MRDQHQKQEIEGKVEVVDMTDTEVEAERNEGEESSRFDEVRVENLKTHFVKPGALLIST